MSSVNIVKYNINENWLNEDAMQFFKSLSFDGYILAGNSVTNMIQEIPLQGDLDFWVNSEDDYIRILNEFRDYYDHYNLYPSMVEMISDNDKLPRINLIFAKIKESVEIIKHFDFDYCRCYYTPSDGIMATSDCMECISTKIIKKPNENIMGKRILKAIKYGYVFTNKFWYDNNHLLKKFQNPPIKGDIRKFSVSINDLNLSAFEKIKPSVCISDIANIMLTLNQLYHQYDTFLKMENCELPILLSFKTNQFDLLKSYIHNIVLLNPVSDAHYQSLHIDNHVLNYNNPMMPYKTKKYWLENNNLSQSFKYNEEAESEEEEPPKQTKPIAKPVTKSVAKPVTKPIAKIESEVSDSSSSEVSDSSSEVSDSSSSESEVSNNKLPPKKKIPVTSPVTKPVIKPITIPGIKDISPIIKNKMWKTTDKKNTIQTDNSNHNIIVETHNPRQKSKSPPHGVAIHPYNYERCLINIEPTIKIIKPYNLTPRVIQLNDSGTAYIMIEHLPSKLANINPDIFDTMYALHPKNKHKIIMYENEVETHRYQKSYLTTPSVDKSHLKTHSYMYSGYDDSKNNYVLPELFEPYYQYMKSLDKSYNQVICNWYEDQNDYIAPHSDCTRDMITNGKIAIISIYENPNTSDTRIFDIIPKHNTNALFDKISIHMYHGTIITMCGTTQNDFMHGIAKDIDEKGKRISLSFRQMIDKYQ